MSVEWQQTTDGSWLATVTIARHFKVKYILSSDEEGVWSGVYETRYRVPHKEDDQFDRHELPFSSTTELLTMQKSIEAWHVEQVYPGMLEMLAEYDAPDDDDATEAR